MNDFKVNINQDFQSNIYESFSLLYSGEGLALALALAL